MSISKDQGILAKSSGKSVIDTLESSLDLLVATLHEPRDRSEIEAQVVDIRDAINGIKAAQAKAVVDEEAVLDAWDQVDRATKRVQTALPAQMTAAIEYLETARANMERTLRAFSLRERAIRADGGAIEQA